MKTRGIWAYLTLIFGGFFLFLIPASFLLVGSLLLQAYNGFNPFGHGSGLQYRVMVATAILLVLVWVIQRLAGCWSFLNYEGHWNGCYHWSIDTTHRQFWKRW